MTDTDIRPATAEAARHLTDRIKVAVEATWQLVSEAYLTRAWAALGYGSWDEYCTREFGTSRLRLPREERQEVVASLRESGMSTRAIAAATGINRETVRQESGDNKLSPAPGNGDSPRVTGADGRSYPSSWRPSPQPAPLPRPPLPASSREPEPGEQAEKLDRLRQMADEAERADPYVPIRELVDVRDALRRAIPKMRALKNAGQSVGADALTAGIASLCKELEELL